MANHEIISTRIFNAPQETLFRAWEDPDHLKNWWGPAGFTNTFHEFDFRPGGTWKFTMHGPEKGNYENEVVFTEIERLSLIVWDRISQPLFRIRAEFEPVEENKTKLIFRMIFNSAGERDKLIKFVPEKNEENFDKLEKELKNMTNE